MEKLLKFKNILNWLIPIVWCFAFIGMMLCCFYLNIYWNSEKFKTFYHNWDFFIAYLLEVIGIAIFFVFFLIVAKKKSTIFQKIISSFS